MGRTSSDFNSDDLFNSASLLGQFMLSFQFGRVTANECPADDLEFPSPESGCSGLKTIIAGNLFDEEDKPWFLVAALQGANILGHTVSSTRGTLSNQYFKSMLLNGWTAHPERRGFWSRADRGSDVRSKETMADSDLCLAIRFNHELSYCKAFIKDEALCD